MSKRLEDWHLEYKCRHGGLLVLMDFDGTITRKREDGCVMTMMSCLRRHPQLARRTRQSLKQWRKREIRIMADARLSNAKREEQMQIAWRKSMEVLCASNFSSQLAAELARERGLRWRQGVADFLRHLLDCGAWICIFSASLIGENVIPESLLRHGFTPRDKICVVSNGIVCTPNDKRPYRQTMITPLNKKGGLFLRDKLPRVPQYCLVVGDARTDANMADGLPIAPHRVMKVAFGSPGVHRRAFAKSFDEVLPPDASMLALEVAL